MAEKYDLLEINTDGGSRGNPGSAGIGVYAASDGKKVFTLSETIGETTNNVAEYTAVIRSLETLQEKEIYTERLKYILDSELIVRQILGKYKVKQPHLQLLRQRIVELVKRSSRSIIFTTDISSSNRTSIAATIIVENIR